jgi:transcriptional regulator with XRE-family HTH domain
MEVYKKILDFIAKKRIKLETLAKDTGITKGHLNNMLIGEAPIDIIDYYKICKALKVPMETFVK